MSTSMPGVLRTCGGSLKVSTSRPGGLPHVRGVFKSVDEQAGGSSARAGGL